MGAAGAAFTAMASGIPAIARFRTFQAFRNAILVDPGAAGVTAGYLNSVAGTATFTGGATITASWTKFFNEIKSIVFDGLLGDGF